MRFHQFAILGTLLLSAFKAAAAVPPAKQCFQPVPQELYAREKLEQFPCDLQAGPKPPIVVAGEVHEWAINDPSTTPEYRRRAVLGLQWWNQIESEAKTGRVVWAKEGGTLLRRIHDFYGIEDSLAFLANALPFFYMATMEQLESALQVNGSQRDARVLQARKFMFMTFDTLLNNAYAQQAWKRVPRPLKGGAEKWAKFFDAFPCAPNASAVQAPVVSRMTWNDLVDAHAAVAELLRQIPSLLGDLKLHNVNVNVARLSEVILDIASRRSGFTDKDNAELFALTFGWRESLMAANISKLYCATRSANKPVVVQVGEAHQIPLESRLRRMAMNSRLEFKAIQRVSAADMGARLAISARTP